MIDDDDGDERNGQMSLFFLYSVPTMLYKNIVVVLFHWQKGLYTKFYQQWHELICQQWCD